MERGSDMRLKVENFAKIKTADIEINGITVIGGENNTGKSTVGKILYTLFTIFHNFDDKIMTEKKAGILQYILREGRIQSIDKMEHIVKFVEELVQSENTEIDSKYIEDVLNNQFELKFNETHIKEILNRLNFETNRLERLVIKSIFNDEFNKQISPIYDENLVTKLELDIKDEKIELEFNKNNVEIKEKMELLNDGIYIDNPFIIDVMEVNKQFGMNPNKYLNYIFGRVYYDHTTSLREKLRKSLKFKNESLMESDLLKERIEKFVSMITEAIHGDFIEKEDEFAFSDNTYGKEFKLANLST